MQIVRWNKIVIVCRWHDSVQRKSYRLHQKKLLDLINEFGKTARSKVYIHKSKAFLYTNDETPEAEFRKEIPFDIARKKIKLEYQLTPYRKINSRWIEDLNISHDTIKVLEENIGRKIWDIPYSSIFTDMSPRAMDIKERINKWDLIKIKTSSMAKENSTKIKRRTNRMEKYIFQWYLRQGFDHQNMWTHITPLQEDKKPN